MSYIYNDERNIMKVFGTKVTQINYIFNTRNTF